MSNRHAHTILALPINVPNLKCNACSKKDVTVLCIGCYESFCFDCHKKHRQKIWTNSNNSIYEDEIFKALFQLKASEMSATTTASTRKLDPFLVLKQIKEWEEDLKTTVKTMAEEARQNLRTYIDERYDEIIKRFTVINENLRTRDTARPYFEKKLPNVTSTLCDINNVVEDLPSTMSVCFQSRKIDLTDAMKIVATRNPSGKSGTKRRPSTAHSAKTFEASDFDELTKSPYRKIEKLGSGLAIGASNKYIIYTNENDLCMTQTSKDYHIAFPLKEVVDICWCAEADYFVILTKRQVHTLNPNKEELHPIDQIQSTGRSFWRCTYASDTNTLLLCYGSHGSPIEEWTLSDREKAHSWQAPQSCEMTEYIQCIRVSLDGHCVALTINNDEEDYFVVRDRAMRKIRIIPLHISDCLSFVSLPNNTWLLSALHYHKLFFINSNYDMQKITQTEPGRASTKGIAMVGANVVVERTASTLCFFHV